MLDEPDPTTQQCPLVYVLAYSGMRWGEAAALRRARCDLLRSRLEVVESLADVGGHLHYGATKTYASRAVVLPGFLRDMMAAHLAAGAGGPDDPVFTSPKGGPLRNQNFARRYWRPAVEAAGFDGLRIHDLRHTCASLLIDQGANVKAIQTHLGHSSAQVTLDRYAHLMPDELDRLAESLDGARASALAACSRPGRGPDVVQLADRADIIGS